MVKKKTNKDISTTIDGEVAAIMQPQVHKDAVVALLVVSLIINLFILTAWVTLQVTSVYDTQVASFLFTR